MKTVKSYARGGFVTQLFLMYMEFEKVKDKVGLTEVNTTAAREHVAKIERKNRLEKQRTWRSTSDMTDCGIKYLHTKIVINMVYNICLWLNELPLKSGLYMEYFPREIVTQRPFNYEKYRRA